MEHFGILGIEPTQDKEAIKQAYHKLLPSFNPEDDPDGFRRLREAYEQALKHREDEPADEDNSETGIWLRKATAVYEDFGRRLDPGQWSELLADDVCAGIDSAALAGEKLLGYLMEHSFVPHEVWHVLEEHFAWEDKRQELCNVFPAGFIDFVCANSKYPDDFRYLLFEVEPGKDYDLFIGNYFYLLNNMNEQEATDKAQRLAETVGLGIEHPDFTILRIRYALNDEDHGLAAELRDELLQMRPDDSETLYWASRVEHALGNTGKSKEYSDRILAKDPDHVSAATNIADCLFMEGAFDEALVKYKEMAARLPYNVYIMDAIFDVYTELAKGYAAESQGQNDDNTLKMKRLECAVETRKFDEALEILGSLVPAEDEEHEFRMLAGRAHDGLADHEKSLACYKEALAAYDGDDEGKAKLHAEIGLKLLDSGRYEDAVKEYDTGLSLVADSDILNYRKAAAFTKLGKYKESVELCDKVLSGGPVPNAYHFKAEALYHLGEYEDAFENCRLALQIMPYYSTYELELQILHDAGQHEQLLELAKYMQSINCETDNVLMFKGKALLDTEKYDEAEIIFERLLESGGGNTEELNYRLGFLHMQKGEVDKALRCYKNVIRLNPDHPYAHGELADLYYQRLDKIDKALEHVQKQLAKCEQPYYHNLCGILQESSGRFEEGLDCYRKAMEMDPDYSYPCQNAGRICLYEMGMSEEAATYFKAAIELGYPDASPYWGLIIALGKLKRYDEAITFFNAGAARFPDESYLYNRIGQMCYKLQRYEEALEYHKKGFAVSGDMHDCIQVGRSCLKLADYSAALGHFGKAHEIDGKSPDPYEEMGDVHYKTKDYRKAIQCFKKSFKLGRDSGYAPLQLGKCYKELKKPAKAMEHFRTALKNYLAALSSADASVCDYKHAGDVYVMLGDKDKAVELYEKAINGSYAYCVADGCFEACDDLGKLHEESGDLEKAISAYEMALDMISRPEYMETIQRLRSIKQ